MYSGHARLSVCLSVRGRMPTLLQRRGCNLGKCSCKLLADLRIFAIGARVALLRQHSANATCQRVLVGQLALCLVSIVPLIHLKWPAARHKVDEHSQAQGPQGRLKMWEWWKWANRHADCRVGNCITSPDISTPAFSSPAADKSTPTFTTPANSASPDPSRLSIGRSYRCLCNGTVLYVLTAAWICVREMASRFDCSSSNSSTFLAPRYRRLHDERLNDNL